MVLNGSSNELEFRIAPELTVNISSLEHVLVSLSLFIIPTANDSLFNLTNEVEEGGEVLTDKGPPRRGDVEIELVSPSGTRSTLLLYRDYDFINTEGYHNWPFMSVHFWGESPIGSWTLHTTYRSSAGSVFLANVTLTGFGVGGEPAGNRNRGVCEDCLRGCGEVCDVCSRLRYNLTLACVDTCPNGTTQYNGYCIEGRVIYPPTADGTDTRTTVVILGSVAAVVVAILVIVALVVLIVALVTRKRRRNRSRNINISVYCSLPNNDDETAQI